MLLRCSPTIAESIFGGKRLLEIIENSITSFIHFTKESLFLRHVRKRPV